jgi:16S rRNA processing protein RimM
VENSVPHLVRLGVISGAHGVKGQVKIRSFTAVPEDMASYGDLRDKSGKIYRLAITGQGKERVLIASVEGVASRDEAEKLRNIELYVERGALSCLNENEYYYEDIIGLAVFTRDNALYGRLIAMHNFGAGDIAEIKRASGEEEFQPFSKATFPVIDIPNRRLVIVPPESVE